MDENNQIVNQVKNILTPPNWENEGKNKTLNKEYKAIRYHNNTNDTINYDISNLINYLTGDYDQAAYGPITVYHPFGRKTGTWISEETYTPLIDMETIGLAELETHGETTLLRTSKYLSKGEGKDFRSKSNYVTEFNFNRDARILTIKNDDDLKYLKDNYLIKLDRIPDEYDESIQHIRLDWNRIQNDYDVFQVRVNDYSNASEELLDFTWGMHGGFNNEGFIMHPKNAIESYKTYERENFEYNINPSQYKEYKYNKENKEFELIYDGLNKNDIKKITPQEAFDKYGPDDDRFYTSQGLDPKEQRAKINKLNSKRKPVLSNEEILEQLHKETEEAAEQFYNTAKEVKESLDSISSQLEDIKSEPKEEPTIETNTNTEQTIKNTIQDTTNNNTSKLEDRTIQETTNNSTSRLENRTVQDTAKKSLNTKKLGIAIAGAAIAVAGVTAMASDSKKKKDKEEYVNKTNNINANINNRYIDYNNDLQYANQITSYSRGHSTYSL